MVDYNRTLTIENTWATVSQTDALDPMSMRTRGNYYLVSIEHDGEIYEALFGKDSLSPLRSTGLNVGDRIRGKFQYRPIGGAAWFQPYLLGLRRQT